MKKFFLMMLAVVCCGIMVSAEDFLQVTLNSGTVTKISLNEIADFRFVSDHAESTQFTITTSVNNAQWGNVTGAGSYEEGATATLTATAASGYYFVEWQDGVKTNPRSVTVTADASYTATFAEVVPNEIAGHEYVDLGLPSGTLWAKCNIGSENAWDYGEFYAWGETETKQDYSETNYVYATYHDTDGLQYYEYQDLGNIAGTQYDVAHVKWGGTWKMPTESQMSELKNYCTWTWITYNGKCGYRVSSNATGNTNWIFLPAAGSGNSSSLADYIGYYWTATPYESNRAYYLSFKSSYYYNLYTGANTRTMGASIRPVATISE